MQMCRIALALAVLGGRAAGQIAGGSIVGTIVDPSGAPVAGVKVVATEARTNISNETRSNPTGYYEFPLLPAGRYVIRSEAGGFRPVRSEEFDLNSGTRPRVDLRLALGQVTESVEVVAAAPLVNATTTELGNVLGSAQIEALPLNSRDFQQLVGLQAGVQAAPSSAVGGRGGIEFNGSPSFGNNLLLDGVDMSFIENNATASDQAAGGGTTGALVNMVSVEAIEEFKVASNAFSAEHGRALGGVLNVTTKSGTNQFHGTLFEFFRHDKLDANAFFSNLAGLGRPPLRWNQFGGNLGGPIRRNRIFFFQNYEGASVRRAVLITGNVPTPALATRVTPALRETFKDFPQEFTPTSNVYIGLHRRNGARRSDEHTSLTRGDIHFTRHRLGLRYSKNHQDASTPGLPRVAGALVFPFRGDNAVLQDSWTVSPSFFNEFRAGFNRVDINRSYPGADALPGYVSVSGLGLSNTRSNNIWWINTSTSVVDNLTWIRGRHTMKAGFEARRINSTHRQGGRPFHQYITADDLIADKPNNVVLFFGNPGRPLDTVTTGFFVQDDWRIRRTLQLNLGLRYEYYSPLTGAFNIKGSDPFGPFGTNREGIYRNDFNNLAPRVGIVWDPTGEQRFVVRAGGGITFMPPVIQWFADMGFIDPRLPLNTNMAPSDAPPGIYYGFPFPYQFADQIVANPDLLPKSTLLGRQIQDYNRNDEYAGQWNLSLQFAVTRSLAIQGSYVGSRALKLWAARQVNTFYSTGRRLRPDIGDVIYRENAGRTSYHAFQFSANQRLAKGMSGALFYTFSKTLAYHSIDTTLGSQDTQMQDPFNLAGSYGPKTGDVNHLFSAVYSYDLPFAPPAGWLRALGGWKVQGILGARSGLPVNPLSGLDFVNNRRPQGQRPDLVGGVPFYIRDKSTQTWFNRAAFDNAAPQRERRFGNTGFNIIRGPGAFTFDASLHKSFRFLERHEFTFRFEAFNLLNHLVLGNPVNTVTNPNFGRILTGQGGRNIQLALKYRF
ncbi:MAG: TonB-dependent receptor domain-containing protein [Bryobacteraceae bacterium]